DAIRRSNCHHDLTMPRDCEACNLRRRERELLHRSNFEAWCAQLPITIAQNFRRGFVESVTCTAADWLEHADAILACQPVREVALTSWPDWRWIDSDMEVAVLWRPQKPFAEVYRDNMPDGCLIPQFLLEQAWSGIRFTLPAELITNAPEVQI